MAMLLSLLLLLLMEAGAREGRERGSVAGAGWFCFDNPNSNVAKKRCSLIVVVVAAVVE
jgi:hypothetical protein